MLFIPPGRNDVFSDREMINVLYLCLLCSEKRVGNVYSKVKSFVDYVRRALRRLELDESKVWMSESPRRSPFRNKLWKVRWKKKSSPGGEVLIILAPSKEKCFLSGVYLKDDFGIFLNLDPIFSCLCVRWLMGATGFKIGPWLSNAAALILQKGSCAPSMISQSTKTHKDKLFYWRIKPFLYNH